MGIDSLCDINLNLEIAMEDSPNSIAQIPVPIRGLVLGVTNATKKRLTCCEIKDIVYIGSNWCQIEFLVKGNVKQCVLKPCHHLSSRRGQQTNNAPNLSLSFCQIACEVRLDLN
jgi:hypothetical protein